MANKAFTEEEKKFNEFIGGFFARLREKRGIRQMDIAPALGLCPSNISRMERGEASISVLDFIVLCRELGVDSGDTMQYLELSGEFKR